MRGSIAIWHEKEKDSANGYAPRVEVHINMWKGDRDSKQRRFHLFDIGLLFKEVRSIKTLSLCLPFVIEREQITDLFGIMNDDTTLSAIFNETLTAHQEVGRSITSFEAKDEKGRTLFFVTSCDTAQDLTMREVGSGDDAGMVITWKREFLDRLNGNIGDHYLRIRIAVPYDTPNGFISEIHPKESAFLSTISTNEIVEFRLNEPRDFSAAILKELEPTTDRKPELIEVTAVHYFLIRNMSVEMTQSHTGFKKMRRLEPRIWTRYLEDEPQFAPDKMIIYHWSSPPKERVDSFKALATFRSYYTGRLAVYAAVIIGLGALGSALQGLLASGFLIFMGGKREELSPIVKANILIALLLSIVLCVVVKFTGPNSLSPMARYRNFQKGWISCFQRIMKRNAQ